MQKNKIGILLIASMLLATPPVNLNKVYAAESTASQSVKKLQEEYSIDFNQTKYTTKTMTVEGKAVVFRAYEGIVYVKNPVDVQYQSMNIYIPEAYFSGGKIGNYTAENAPIFFPNTVGGYMPALPGTPGYGDGMAAGRPAGVNNQAPHAPQAELGAPQAPQAEVGAQDSPNAALVALSKGYVVAEPGARGRTLKSEDGSYYGKAPAVIVDLKAAVRYLRYNDKVMPGSAEKIISDGTSAGGGVSALLGATGNSLDYEPYLKVIGAADQRDDIFATMAYCPITNLDNADMAYEWLLNGIVSYQSMNISFVDGQIKRETVQKEMTKEEIQLSNELKAAFSDYVNSLGLTGTEGKKLELNKEGEGSFKAYLEKYVLASAQSALDNGEDLSKYTYLTISNGKVTRLDFAKYVTEQLGRGKTAPSFDNVNLASGATAENNLFGTELIDSQHFTQFSSKNATSTGTTADSQIVKMMNPMNYIGQKGVTTSPYWRIRYGTADSNTSLAVPLILATKLQNDGYSVDFAMPWAVGHRGDYDLKELFAWSDGIVAEANATPSISVVQVDNQKRLIDAYIINGSSFVQLNDLAMVFKDSAKEFAIEGDGNITTNKVYSPNGSELEQSKLLPLNSSLTVESYKLNGNRIGLMTAQLNGHTYVRLKDLAKELDFKLYYDSKTKRITIDTTVSNND